MAIGIKFPFEESYEGGIFRYTKTTPEAIRTNLIALLTLKRKQRPMNNGLYSPLWDVIFEPWDEISADQLQTALQAQLSKYMPEISVNNIGFSFDDNTSILTTTVTYSITALASATDFVQVDVQIQPNK